MGRRRRRRRPSHLARALPFPRTARLSCAHAQCQHCPLTPRTLRLFPAPPAEPPSAPQRARTLARCLPGVVVSVLRAGQVQWPRSGAAAPERRGGSRTDTRETQDAGLAVAGRRRGAQERRVRSYRARGKRQGKARRRGRWSGHLAWKMHKSKGPPGPPGRGAAAARQVSLSLPLPTPPTPTPRLPEETLPIPVTHLGEGPTSQGNLIATPR